MSQGLFDVPEQGLYEPRSGGGAPVSVTQTSHSAVATCHHNPIVAGKHAELIAAARPAHRPIEGLFTHRDTRGP